MHLIYLVITIIKPKHKKERQHNQTYPSSIYVRIHCCRFSNHSRHINLYIYIYIVCVCVCVCVWERERERERERETNMIREDKKMKYNTFFFFLNDLVLEPNFDINRCKPYDLHATYNQDWDLIPWYSSACDTTQVRSDSDFGVKSATVQVYGNSYNSQSDRWIELKVYVNFPDVLSYYGLRFQVN